MTEKDESQTKDAMMEGDDSVQKGAEEGGGGGEYNDEEYAEDGEEEDELYDDEDDDDANQEAEEMAKRLGDALWADISKAFAATTTQQESNAAELDTTSHDDEDHDDEETLVNAVQQVIDLTEVHSELLQKLSEAALPNSEDNLYDALNDIVHSRQVSAEQANVLGDLVQSILDGDFFQ